MIRNALTFAIAVMLASFASARADTQNPQQTSPQSTVLPGMSSAPQPTGVDPFQPPSKDPDLQVPVPPLGDSPLSSAEMDTLMNWIAVRASAQQLPYCWRQSYGNGAGAPYTCKEGLERNGLLCYPKCNEGFSGNGPVCWGSCPSGFTDIGAFCQKPAAYGRGAGYAIWSKGACQHDHGADNCEQWGLLWYPKCKAGFHPAGCCICSPDCPKGWSDTGSGCTKPSYGRGAGEILAMGVCAPGLEKDPTGALCYPACKSGFHMVGPVCWQNCPSQQSTDCAAGCATNAKVCAEATVKEAFTPVMAAVSLVPVVGLATTKIAAAAGSAERVAEFLSLYNSIQGEACRLGRQREDTEPDGHDCVRRESNRSGFVRLV